MTPATAQDQLDQSPPVLNTYVQRSAFNPTTYASVARGLQGYLEGSRITIDYFWQETQGDDLRTAPVVYLGTENPVHVRYTRVRNYEITLPAPLTFNWDSDKQEGEIFGEAMLYPGLNPIVGDMFLMSIGDGNDGLMRVSQVAPLSYRSDRVHKITFRMIQVATEIERQQLLATVAREYYFIKDIYLGDNHTLLTATEVQSLDRLAQLREQLIGHTLAQFYQRDIDSLLGPDGVYDPHVVRFFCDKTSIVDTEVRPRQLVPTTTSYDQTVWARLLNPRMTTLWGLASCTGVYVARGTSNAASLTPIIGRFVRTALPLVDGAPPAGAAAGYAGLGPAFYAGTLAEMTPWEAQIYAAIVDRRIADVPGMISAHIAPTFAMDLDVQFYRLPLCLHLTDVASATLAHRTL